MFKSFLFRILPIFVAFSLLFPGYFDFDLETAIAQTTLEQQEAELRRQLQKIEAEQAELQKALNSQKSQTAGFQRDVNILNDQIKKAELEIQKKRLEIQQLSKDISQKNQTVAELEIKTARSREALSELIRRSDELDRISLVEVLLSNRNLSDFFTVLDSYNTMQNQLEDLFEDIRENIYLTEAEKESLLVKQSRELDATKVIESERSTVASKKNERSSLLNTSKQAEASYAQVLAEKQKQAAAIRAALFRLRDSQGISFGEALAFAEKASQLTGVRAAFILGILKQESNIGQHVGSCVITNLTTGETEGVNTKTKFANGIHPTRDLPLLATILNSLGRDPLVTRVSCPLSVGYGGAMGPAQFIPSTWNAYIPRLQSMFGVYPDPWNPEHSFTASATFLKDLGAAAGGYSAEHQAAARYYAGGNWATLGQGYATSVLRHAEEMQTQIDFLKEVANN